MSSTPFRLLLARQIHTEIVRHAQLEQPNECCGLLAGTNSEDGFVKTVTKCYPLVNELASPIVYRSEAGSHFAAIKDITRYGLKEVAVYHSHPTSAPLPSRKDLAENLLGDHVLHDIHVIVSLAKDLPETRAWRLCEATYEEVFLEIFDP